MRFIFFLLMLLISPAASQAQNICPSTAVLSRLQDHISREGETLDSIAQNYNLSTQTLLNFNPTLKNQNLLPGTVVVVPPLNGRPQKVPQGATWQDLSKASGVRADVLFELNGCQAKPTVVFIPGLVKDSPPAIKKSNYTGLSGYPFPELKQVGLAYGWQKKASSLSSGNQSNLFFHSGIDLLAPLNTPVLATEKGTVVFIGFEGSYGNLIIINHQGEIQTRYAHLGKVKVQIGNVVKVGQIIGVVGRTGEPDIVQPHLHFEVRSKQPLGWISQDPLLHLNLPLSRPTKTSQ